MTPPTSTVQQHHPFLDADVTPFAQPLLRDLLETIGAQEVRRIPTIVFRQPDLAPPAVSLLLRRLRALLTAPQYAYLAQELIERVDGGSLDRRRQLLARARDSDLRARAEERQRELDIQAEARARARARSDRAELAAAQERERLAQELREHELLEQRGRATIALAALDTLLLREPFAVSQTSLDALLPRTEQSVLRARVRDHVRAWFAARSERLSGDLPDDAQLDVITHLEDDLLVEARAGSGKTRALTYRAMFLIEACGVSPDDVLLLVFNRKAAAVIRERLEAMQCPLPHAMTFHAFGVALERPDADIVTDDEDEQGFSTLRVALAKIVQKLERTPRFTAELRHLMLTLTREHVEEEPPLATLSGEWAESHEDALLLDLLFEHGLAARYQRSPARTHGEIREVATFALARRNYVVAFSDASVHAPTSGVSGAPIAERVYLPHLPTGMARDAAFVLWKKVLMSSGIVLVQLTDEEIWARVHARLRDAFLTLATSYVMRMRNQGMGATDRRAWVAAYRTTDFATEGRFLALAEEVYLWYERGIDAGAYADFQQVIMAACSALRDGKLTWHREHRSGDVGRLRYVMVDEFQDVSPLFMRLLDSIRAANRRVSFMGVGDDWQAINGFAGASPRYFREFEKHFRQATRRSLSTNYRSQAAVVDLGNDIMAERPLPAIASQAEDGVLLRADLESFRPLAQEVSEFKGRLMPALRRLAAACVSEGGSVVLLSRTREPVAGYRRTWMDVCLTALPVEARLRARGSTIHKFKGEEADVAIIVDASGQRFPMIASSWMLFRIFGDTRHSLIEDERQLLYVAVSRAAKTVICIVNSEHADLSYLFGAGASRFQALQWSDYPAPRSDGRRSCLLTVRDFQTSGERKVGTFGVKELLKTAGFTYSTEGGPHWARGEVWGENDVDEIARKVAGEPWVTGGDGLAVCLTTDSQDVVGEFAVMKGRWTKL